MPIVIPLPTLNSFYSFQLCDSRSSLIISNYHNTMYATFRSSLFAQLYAQDRQLSLESLNRI